MAEVTNVCRLSSSIAIIRKLVNSDNSRYFDIGIHVKSDTVIVVSLEQSVEDIPLIYIVEETCSVVEARNKFIELLGSFTFMEEWEGKDYFNISSENRHMMYGTPIYGCGARDRYFAMAKEIYRVYSKSMFSKCKD